MIRELTAADLPSLVSSLIAPTLAASPLHGWIATGRDGAVEGVMLDVEGRRGDLLADHWRAISPRVLTELYSVAAEVWVAAGITTHRMVAARADPAAGALVDLGFGHQQAFSSQSLESLGARLSSAARQATVEVRAVCGDEVAQLTTLVPMISLHQAGSPVFAPRTPQFFEQLPASIAEYVEDPTCGAWLAWANGTAVGFALAECSEEMVELALIGVSPGTRQSGTATALVANVIEWGHAQGATTAVVDWRTTNTLAAAFWAGLGFVPSEYRWARTIDLTPA